MDNLLQQAHIDRYCNACGGTYRVTLYDMLLNHRTNGEWQPARPCSVCSGGKDQQLTAMVPGGLLEELDSAWTRVQEAAQESGLQLRLDD